MMHRDITEPGGVHAVLITLFTDRNDVLIRGELHLDAARSTAHQPLSARLTATPRRVDRGDAATHRAARHLCGENAEIADEANLSLGSVTYHFAERANIIDAALDAFATEAKAILTDGLFESTVHTNGDAGAGVRAALVTLLADRTRVLIRAELALEIARADTQQTYYDRTHTVLTRLLTAASHYADRPTDEDSISAALIDLDAVALTTAAQHRRPAHFTIAMTAHIDALYGVTG